MASISIGDITTGSIDGTGIFDKLMQSIQARLDEQYQLNRIKSTDYSTVYLGAIDSAMQQSIAFVLGQQQADKQAELLSAQANTEALQTQVIANEVVKTALQGDLIEQDILVKQQQVLSEQESVFLTRAKVKTEALQPTIVENQIVKTNIDNKLAEQEVLVKQQQVLTEQENIELIKAKVSTESLQPQLLSNQIIKTDSDNRLIEQDILVKQQNVLSEIQNVELIKAKVKSEALQPEIVQNQIIKTGIDSKLADQEVLVKQQQVLSEVQNVELMKAKVKTEALQPVLVDNQIIKVTKDTDLVDQNILNIQQDILKSKEEVLESTADRKIKENQFIMTSLDAAEYPTTIENNRTKLIKDIELSTSQRLKVDADELLTDSQKLLTDTKRSAEINNVNLVLQKVYTERANIQDNLQPTTDNTGIGGLIAKQKAKLDEERDLLILKSITENNQQNVLNNQAIKTNKESDLLSQKEVTEWAQTQLLGKSGTVSGVVGKQIDLYTEQKNGFVKDAKIKGAKLLSDIYAVAQTTEATSIPDAAIPNGEVGTSGTLDTSLNNLISTIELDQGSV